jgi:tetratricopeptide (TPR) repeat protein
MREAASLPASVGETTAPQTSPSPSSVRRPFDRLRRLTARVVGVRHWPRSWWIGVATCAVLLAASTPFGWAAYHWYAGQSALKRYHNAEARAHLNKCLKIWPWSRNVRTHLQAVLATRRDGDIESAVQRLRQCQSTLGDNSPELVLEWALLHAAGGDLRPVEEQLHTRARQHPDQAPLILEALAEGYMRTSRSLDALRCLEVWLDQQPENTQALYLRGNLFRQTDAPQKASADYRRVIELDPERHDARWNLVLVLLPIGRYQEAADHLRILRQRRPDDLEVLVRLAICNHRMGKSREARPLLDTVLARRPDHGLALLTRAQMALTDGDLLECEKWLRLALRARPKDYKTNWFLAECLQKQERKEEAEAQRARAEKIRARLDRQAEITGRLISEHPDDPALPCELGEILLELDDPQHAEIWFHSALRLDEHYVPALKALADYYQQRGDMDKSEEYRLRVQQSADLPSRERVHKKPAPTPK